MKNLSVILTFIVCILSFANTYAISININWNYNFKKDLVISCEEDQLCESYFGTQIAIKESKCSDCFSTDLNQTFLFNGIGESITNSLIPVGEVEFYSYLIDNRFVSISYDSPYDLVTNDSAMKKRLKYRSLCEDPSQDPILFFDLSEKSEVSTPKYIYCGENQIFELELFDVDIISY